jgi:hypothetical protein
LIIGQKHNVFFERKRKGGSESSDDEPCRQRKGAKKRFREACKNNMICKKRQGEERTEATGKVGKSG